MQLSISPYASAQQTSKKKAVEGESAGDRSLLRASLSTWIGTHPASPYPLAIGAVVLALLIGHPLGRTFGESILYIAIFPAIAFSAWYCGAGPSIVSMVVAVPGLRLSVCGPRRRLPPVREIPLPPFYFNSRPCALSPRAQASPPQSR